MTDIAKHSGHGTYETFRAQCHRYLHCTPGKPVRGGRTTVWVRSGSGLVFKYGSSRHPSINQEWIDALAFTANAPGGLYLVPEPVEVNSRDAQRLPEPA